MSGMLRQGPSCVTAEILKSYKKVVKGPWLALFKSE